LREENNMKKGLFRKGILLGIICLFVGIAIQPGIIADDVIKSDNSELVEIIIQICGRDGTKDHTVMLSEEQAAKLEVLINRTKTKLDAAETMEETSAIFNDAVVSLYELGVLPEGMSIEEAKRLVNGMDQNPRVVNKLEHWFFRNQEKRETFDNFLCLIAGRTDWTTFVGPLFIPLLILGLIIGTPLVLLDVLLFRLFETFIFIPILFPLFFGIGGLCLSIWQLNPIAFGHIIKLGTKGMFGFPIPALGWIYTIGFNGIKSWDSFYGGVLGFTGIKICYPPIGDMTHFYMGAALMVLPLLQQ